MKEFCDCVVCPLGIQCDRFLLIALKMLPCVMSEWTGPTFFLLNINGIVNFNCKDLCSQGKKKSTLAYYTMSDQQNDTCPS